MSNTTTRHSARCKTEGCNRFVATGKPHCGACDASYTRGRAASDGAVKRLMEDLRTAREAAVKDHEAHKAEMEAQERKADAALATRTEERDDAQTGAQGAIAQRDAYRAQAERWYRWWCVAMGGLIGAALWILVPLAMKAMGWGR